MREIEGRLTATSSAGPHTRIEREVRTLHAPCKVTHSGTGDISVVLTLIAPYLKSLMFVYFPSTVAAFFMVSALNVKKVISAILDWPLPRCAWR